MFPWYSGTSADMYRTVFGLVVSLKLFLGRFDVRTMQARLLTAWDSPEQLNLTPYRPRSDDASDWYWGHALLGRCQ